MDEDKPPEELDLLALTDGLLDGDPARKAEVEASLDASPLARERVRAFRAQNEALRAAYAARADEPVPERLRAVLEIRSRRSGGNGLRAAAALFLAALAGIGGWAIGQRADLGGGQVSTLLEQSFEHFTAGAPLATPIAGVQTAQLKARSLGWLADEVAIRMKAPDLSQEGYALVDKRAVAIGGDQVVRLDYYQGPGGRTFSLFMAPRWEPQPDAIMLAEREGVALAYWLDGPLATAVASRMPATDIRELAEAVRRAMHAGTTAPARLEPAERRDGVLADTIAPSRRAVPQRLNPGASAITKHN